jgi:DNA-binding protein
MSVRNEFVNSVLAVVKRLFDGSNARQFTATVAELRAFDIAECVRNIFVYFNIFFAILQLCSGIVLSSFASQDHIVNLSYYAENDPNAKAALPPLKFEFRFRDCECTSVGSYCRDCVQFLGSVCQPRSKADQKIRNQCLERINNFVRIGAKQHFDCFLEARQGRRFI